LVENENKAKIFNLQEQIDQSNRENQYQIDRLRGELGDTLKLNQSYSNKILKLKDKKDSLMKETASQKELLRDQEAKNKTLSKKINEIEEEKKELIIKQQSRDLYGGGSSPVSKITKNESLKRLMLDRQDNHDSQMNSSIDGMDLRNSIKDNTYQKTHSHQLGQS
jgi:hypothetical protein